MLREQGEALTAAEVRHLAAGSFHRADAFRDASFLIVESGFVVVRCVNPGRRGIVVCHAGSGSLLPAPEPGETLQALADARVTLVSEALYLDLLRRPGLAAVLSYGLRASLRQQHDSIVIL